jgi:signal transduction histidine kinase
VSTDPVPEQPLGVLVVDDTPDLRDLLRMALERRGEYRVVAEASNGREGIELAASHEPDLVLLDISMPVMDGLEALPRIRAACPQAAVVMLSGFGATEMTERALAMGADGYIQKGQSIRLLLEQLRGYVERASVLRGTRLPPLSTGPQAPSRLAAAAADADVDQLVPTTRPAVLDHLELAPIGFLHVRDGTVLRSNREAVRLFGGLSSEQLPLAEAAPEIAAHLLAHPDGESTATLELGEPPRRVKITVRPSGDDQVVYAQAEPSDEADLLRRSIATAAHEIRNPVSILAAAAEALLDEEINEGVEKDRMLAMIMRQAHLLDAITADLLTAGQAQHGTLALQPQRLAPSELVRSVVAEMPDVTVIDTCTRDVLSDPHRFQQMLGNLLGNARKYGSAPFVVRLRSQDEEVHVDVEDDGDGVPEEFRPHLFQEYSRAPGTSARGTGLGLYVVRALAESQGGRVTYRPGSTRGSVFTISLPAAPG